jgi:hypothetical protein
MPVLRGLRAEWSRHYRARRFLPLMTNGPFTTLVVARDTRFEASV